jgi:hypothetical protein
MAGNAMINKWNDAVSNIRKMRNILIVICIIFIIVTIALQADILFNRPNPDPPIWVWIPILSMIIAIIAIFLYSHSNIQVDTGFEYKIFDIKSLKLNPNEAKNNILQNIENKLLEDGFNYKKLGVSGEKYLINFGFRLGSYLIEDNMLTILIRSNRKSPIDKIKILIGPIIDENIEFVNKVKSSVDEAFGNISTPK